MSPQESPQNIVLPQGTLIEVETSMSAPGGSASSLTIRKENPQELS